RGGICPRGGGRPVQRAGAARGGGIRRLVGDRRRRRLGGRRRRTARGTQQPVDGGHLVLGAATGGGRFVGRFLGAARGIRCRGGGGAGCGFLFLLGRLLVGRALAGAVGLQ